MGETLVLPGATASSLAEAMRDVVEFAVVYAIHPLVGVGAAERAGGFDERPEFHIVEQFGTEALREAFAPTIPTCAQCVAIGEADSVTEMHHALRVAIAAHQSYACNFATIVGDEREQGHIVQLGTGVFPEVRAVAARAVVGAASDVDGERHLIGELLKNNVGTSVAEHKNE